MATLEDDATIVAHIIANFAKSIGASEDALRLMISLLAGARN